MVIRGVGNGWWGKEYAGWILKIKSEEAIYNYSFKHKCLIASNKDKDVLFSFFFHSVF
jgi:hypothetical protein